jgi:hypothetical protein
MKRRFILYRRKRGGMFYLEDTQSKKQESLHTKNRADAVSVLNARNESRRQPQLNLQIAKAYLSGTDSNVTTRTWQSAIESLTNSKQGANQHRWQTAARDNAFVPLARMRYCSSAWAERSRVNRINSASTWAFSMTSGLPDAMALISA